MDEKPEAFLREGLIRYKRASDTIRYFEDNLLTILEGILRNRKNWSPFLPYLNSIKHAKGTKGKTYYIEAYVNGTNSKNIGMNLGIGFDCSKSSPEFYVYIDSKEGNLNNYRSNESVHFIKEGNYFYLRSNPKGEYDFEEEFNLLLNELLANI